jgi:Cys-tRNA(Pro)/Cys-tRNA(Cys) deacylase
MTDPYEDKLRRFLNDRQVQAEHLSFQQSCHSVSEAAKAANAAPDDFVKSICLVDAQGSLIVAIVKGEDRASVSRVGKALGIAPPRLATPEEMLERTGYPCGGTPPFGFEATFLIDPRVLEREIVYAGGGSESALIRLSPREMQRVNGGTLVRVRR